MGKEGNGKDSNKGWDPQEAYKKVSGTINAWPDWKKRAYNGMFSSAHAEKIQTRE